MELIDNRKADRAPAKVYDDFRPVLAGFMPINDVVLLRELKLPEEGMIVSPDAYAEPCLYCEVIAVSGKLLLTENGRTIVRILQSVGTTIAFSDAKADERYLTVNVQDIIGLWRIA